MKRKKLEQKYGKKLIDQIFKEGYLDGCTILIINGEDDIPESDIRLAIRQMRGEPISHLEWD